MESNDVAALFAIGLTVSHIMANQQLACWVKRSHCLMPYGARSTGLDSVFAIYAILNIYVAFSLPLDVWVNFKVFGLLIATLLSTLLTGVYIYKHLPKDQQKELKWIKIPTRSNPKDESLIPFLIQFLLNIKMTVATILVIIGHCFFVLRKLVKIKPII